MRARFQRNQDYGEGFRGGGGGQGEVCAALAAYEPGFGCAAQGVDEV